MQKNFLSWICSVGWELGMCTLQDTSALQICVMNRWGCTGHCMGVTEEQATCPSCLYPWMHAMALPSGAGWEGEEEEALGSRQGDFSYHPLLPSSRPSSV